MPSYTIHLAIAKQYLRRHPEEDAASFYEGVIDPDLLEKPMSHYGKASSCPNLEVFKQKCGLGNSYLRGYYLHLKTDFLFYNQWLQHFSKDIYNDYDILNKEIIEKYQLEIPDKIKNYVKILDEKQETIILHRNMVYELIEQVSAFELEETEGKI